MLARVGIAIQAAVSSNMVWVWTWVRISKEVWVWRLGFGSIIARMVIDMNETQLKTVVQLRAFQRHIGLKSPSFNNYFA